MLRDDSARSTREFIWVELRKDVRETIANSVEPLDNGPLLLAKYSASHSAKSVALPFPSSLVMIPGTY